MRLTIASRYPLTRSLSDTFRRLPRRPNARMDPTRASVLEEVVGLSLGRWLRIVQSPRRPAGGSLAGHAQAR